MPVTIESRENHRVVYLKYTAPLSLQEIFDVYPQDKAYRDAVSHKVHTVIDIREMGEIPQGILSTRFAPSHTHPNSGYVVVIGADTHAQILGGIMAALQGENHFRFFDTEEEAWVFVRQAITKDKGSEALSG